MEPCDRCGDAVDLLLRRREYARSTTHRTTSWLCAECHPDFATDESPAADDARAPDGVPVPDSDPAEDGTSPAEEPAATEDSQAAADSAATDDGSARDGHASGAEETVVTDGGTDLAACPQCSASAINVQGLLECLDCRWIGR